MNRSVESSGPYQGERGIRLFVASTFEDMHDEREELVKFVFPQLRRLYVKGYRACVLSEKHWRGHVDHRTMAASTQAATSSRPAICTTW